MAEWTTQNYADYSNLTVSAATTSSTAKSSSSASVIAGVVKQHRFEKYKHPSADCGYCFKTLWGNELRCKICKFPCHLRCQDSATASCNCSGTAMSRPEWKEEVQQARMRHLATTTASSGASGSTSGPSSSMGVGNTTPGRGTVAPNSSISDIRTITAAEWNSFQDAAAKSASLTETVRVTIQSENGEAKPNDPETLLLTIKHSTTAAALERMVLEKLQCKQGPPGLSKEQGASEIYAGYKLYADDGNASGRSLAPEEKPYGKTKALLFRPVPEAASSFHKEFIIVNRSATSTPTAVVVGSNDPTDSPLSSPLSPPVSYRSLLTPSSTPTGGTSSSNLLGATALSPPASPLAQRSSPDLTKSDSCSSCRQLEQQLADALEKIRRYEAQLEQMNKLLNVVSQGGAALPAGLPSALPAEKPGRKAADQRASAPKPSRDSEAASSTKETSEGGDSTKRLIEYEDLGDRIIFDKVMFDQTSLPPFSVPPKEQPYDRTLHPNHAVWFAYCSALTYADHPAITKVAQEFWKFSAVHFFENEETNTRAVAFVRPEFVIVAFRGTESAENWNTNLNFSLRQLTECDVVISPDISPDWLSKVRLHRGFDDALQTILPRLLSFLEDLLRTSSNPRAIYLTGHSLGGALAQLAFVHILISSRCSFDVNGITSFGQPRVGNQALCEFLEAHAPCVLQRVCNRGDIVPSLPPPKPYKFKHSGNVVFIGQDGELTYDPTGWELGTQRFQRVAGSLGAGGINDHRQYNYVNAMQRYLEVHGKQSSLRVGDCYKCVLTCVRCAGLKKHEYQVRLRSSVPGAMSFHTNDIKGPEPLWNQSFELPEIYTGDEYIAEVWSESRCRGCVILHFHSFSSVELAEFPLHSRPGKNDTKITGSLFLSLSFSLLRSGTTNGDFALFGASLNKLTETIQPSDGCPYFVARCSEAIMRNCLNVRGGFFPDRGAHEMELSGMKLVFNSNPKMTFRRTERPELVLRLFSDWLESLREPLLGYDAYTELVEATLSHIDFSAIILQLDEWRQVTLAHIFSLAEQLVQNGSFTKVTRKDLAAKLGPLLVFSCHPQTKEPLRIAEHQEKIATAIDFLIQHWRVLFLKPAQSIPLGYQVDLFGPRCPELSFSYKLMTAPRRAEGVITSLGRVDLEGQEYIYAGNALGDLHLFESKGHCYSRTMNLGPAIAAAAASSTSSPTEVGGSNSSGSLSACACSGVCTCFHRRKSASMLPTEHEVGIVGVFSFGRTPAARAVNCSSMWCVVLRHAPPIFVLPLGSSFRFRTISTAKTGFSCVAQSNSETLYLGGSNVTLLKVNDLSDRARVCLPPAPGRRIVSLLYIPMLREIWCGDSLGLIHILSDATGKLVSTEPLDVCDGSSVNTLLCCGPNIWVANSSGKLIIVAAESRAVIMELHRGVSVTALCNINAEFTIVGSNDGQVEVWNSETFERCAQFSAHDEAITYVLVARPDPFSEDRVVWVGSEDKCLSVWRVGKFPLPQPVEQASSAAAAGSSSSSAARSSKRMSVLMSAPAFRQFTREELPPPPVRPRPPTRSTLRGASASMEFPKPPFSTSAPPVEQPRPLPAARSSPSSPGPLPNTPPPTAPRRADGFSAVGRIQIKSSMLAGAPDPAPTKPPRSRGASFTGSDSSLPIRPLPPSLPRRPSAQ